MSAENLQRVWLTVSVEDVKTAQDTFPKYNRIVSAIADKHGYSVRIGAAVFAALSPNNDFWGNLRDTNRMLASAAACLPLESFTVSTYGHNKRKAWRVVQGERPEELITARKTRSFFHNICDPACSQLATIDGHMYNMWRNQRTPLATRDPKKRAIKLNDRLYTEIENGVKALACQHGMIPCAMQSALWLAWRRLHKIRTPPQLEMWDRDYLAAGLGFVPA